MRRVGPTTDMMPPAPALRGRSFRMVAASAGLLAAIIAVGSGLLVRDLHDQAVADTERNLTGLSTILADQAERSLQAIELVQETVPLAGAGKAGQARGVQAREPFHWPFVQTSEPPEAV